MALRAIARAPGLRRLPVLKLLALAEIATLARDHANKLDRSDRSRILELVRKAKGRPSGLSQAERDELSALVMKAEPRLFAGMAADKLSPVPLPKRFVHGSKGRAQNGTAREGEPDPQA